MSKRHSQVIMLLTLKGTLVIGSHYKCFESIIGWKIEVWSGGKMIEADLITFALWPYSLRNRISLHPIATK